MGVQGGLELHRDGDDTETVFAALSTEAVHTRPDWPLRGDHDQLPPAGLQSAYRRPNETTADSLVPYPHTKDGYGGIHTAATYDAIQDIRGHQLRAYMLHADNARRLQLEPAKLLKQKADCPPAYIHRHLTSQLASAITGRPENQWPRFPVDEVRADHLPRIAHLLKHLRLYGRPVVFTARQTLLTASYMSTLLAQDEGDPHDEEGEPRPFTLDLAEQLPLMCAHYKGRAKHDHVGGTIICGCGQGVFCEKCSRGHWLTRCPDNKDVHTTRWRKVGQPNDDKELTEPDVGAATGRPVDDACPMAPAPDDDDDDDELDLSYGGYIGYNDDAGDPQWNDKTWDEYEREGLTRAQELGKLTTIPDANSHDTAECICCPSCDRRYAKVMARPASHALWQHIRILAPAPEASAEQRAQMMVPKYAPQHPMGRRVTEWRIECGDVEGSAAQSKRRRRLRRPEESPATRPLSLDLVIIDDNGTRTHMRILNNESVATLIPRYCRRRRGASQHDLQLFKGSLQLNRPSSLMDNGLVTGDTVQARIQGEALRPRDGRTRATPGQTDQRYTWPQYTTSGTTCEGCQARPQAYCPHHCPHTGSSGSGSAGMAPGRRTGPMVV